MTRRGRWEITVEVGNFGCQRSCLFLPVKRALLQGAVLGCSALRILGFKIIKGFTKETRRANRRIANRLAEPGRGDSDNGANERSRSVILAAVTPGVAHVFDFGFVEMRKLVLLGLRRKTEFVDVIDDLTQIVTTLDAVLNLSKDFTDFVLDGVRSGSLLLETLKEREKLAVDKSDEVVASESGVVVDLAASVLRSSPGIPAERFVENMGVRLPIQSRRRIAFRLQSIQVFQEQQPGSLLSVIQLAGTPRVFPEDVIDVLECLFKHNRFYLPTS